MRNGGVIFKRFVVSGASKFLIGEVIEPDFEFFGLCDIEKQEECALGYSGNKAGGRIEASFYEIREFGRIELVVCAEVVQGGFDIFGGQDIVSFEKGYGFCGVRIANRHYGVCILGDEREEVLQYVGCIYGGRRGGYLRRHGVLRDMA